MLSQLCIIYDILSYFLLPTVVLLRPQMERSSLISPRTSSMRKSSPSSLIWWVYYMKRGPDQPLICRCGSGSWGESVASWDPGSIWLWRVQKQLQETPSCGILSTSSTLWSNNIWVFNRGRGENSYHYLCKLIFLFFTKTDKITRWKSCSVQLGE